MTKFEWTTLIGLGLAVVAIFAYFGYLVLSQRSEPPSFFPPAPILREASEKGMTAKEAYSFALELAKSWRGDAEIIFASTVFSDVTDVNGMERSWTFCFYSSSSRKIYTIVVVEGEARPLKETGVPLGLNPVSASNWWVDSPEAISAWLSGGGGDFLARNQEVDLTAALRFPSDGSAPIWTVVGSAEEGSYVLSVLVDAVSGKVVE